MVFYVTECKSPCINKGFDLNLLALQLNDVRASFNERSEGLATVPISHKGFVTTKSYFKAFGM